MLWVAQARTCVTSKLESRRSNMNGPAGPCNKTRSACRGGGSSSLWTSLGMRHVGQSLSKALRRCVSVETCGKPAVAAVQPVSVRVTVSIRRTLGGGCIMLATPQQRK